MANWTSPRTWGIGELVTADMLNTHVRDNMNYLKDSLVQRSVDLDQDVISPSASEVSAGLISWGPINVDGGSILYVNLLDFNMTEYSYNREQFTVPQNYVSSPRVVFDYWRYGGDEGEPAIFGVSIHKMVLGGSATGSAANYGTISYGTIISDGGTVLCRGTISINDFNGATAGDYVSLKFAGYGTPSASKYNGIIRVYGLRFEYS